MRRLWIAVGVVMAVGVLAAPSSPGVAVMTVNPEVAVGAFLSAIGLWAFAAIKKLYDRLNVLIEAFPDVLVALWGPRDANGKRSGGLVEDARAIRERLDELQSLEDRVDRANATAESAQLVASTAADAVKALQRSMPVRGLDR